MAEKSTPAEASPHALPDVSDALVDRMEQAIFAEIGTVRQHDAARARRRRHTTAWIASAAAAVLIAAAAIGPSLSTTPPNQVAAPASADASTSYDESSSARDMAPDQPMDGGTIENMAPTDMKSAESGVMAAADTTQQQIAISAQASLQVTDVEAAVGTVTTYVIELSGIVDSQTIGDPYVMYNVDGTVDTTSAPSTPTSASVAVRVPVESLDAALAKLGEVGTVVGSSTSRTDMTTMINDTDARIKAVNASITRLEELMSGATTTADLIAAETALTDRQAERDSLVQQQEWSKDQVDMASIYVTFAAATPAKANPSGFTEGVANGWDGLIATLNGIILGLGFLLPWIAIAVVIGLIVWLVIRARRRRTADPA